MTIEVTQEDIDRGRRGSCFECPVARAASRAVGAEVSTDRYLFYLPTAKIKTPTEVAKFIHAFDGGEPVAPFSFELPL